MINNVKVFGDAGNVFVEYGTISVTREPKIGEYVFVSGSTIRDGWYKVVSIIIGLNLGVVINSHSPKGTIIHIEE